MQHSSGGSISDSFAVAATREKNAIVRDLLVRLLGGGVARRSQMLQSAVHPPSISIEDPVVRLDASLAR